MEISKAIRTAYFQALNGNITYNSNDVPIYDVYAIPEGVTYPYILLSSQTSSQISVKRCKRYNTTLLVDIVTGNQQPIGRGQSEDIAEQVENIVTPGTFVELDLSTYGYQLLNTELESNTDLSSKNDTYYIFRKLLRFNSLTVKL